MLLRQPPDERVGWGDADRTVERLEIPGKDPQKCGLAGAIGADDSDDVARCHGHVEPLEEGAMGESAGHVLRDERCGHGFIVALPHRDVPRVQLSATAGVPSRPIADVPGPR